MDRQSSSGRLRTRHRTPSIPWFCGERVAGLGVLSSPFEDILKCLLGPSAGRPAFQSLSSQCILCIPVPGRLTTYRCFTPRLHTIHTIDKMGGDAPVSNNVVYQMAMYECLFCLQIAEKTADLHLEGTTPSPGTRNRISEDYTCCYSPVSSASR